MPLTSPVHPPSDSAVYFPSGKPGVSLSPSPACPPDVRSKMTGTDWFNKGLPGPALPSSFDSVISTSASSASTSAAAAAPAFLNCCCRRFSFHDYFLSFPSHFSFVAFASTFDFSVSPIFFLFLLLLSLFLCLSPLLIF